MDALGPQVKRTLGGGRVLAAFLMASVMIGGRANAQTVSAPALKAAYLYNLARFAEWPPDVVPAGTRIVMCVDNDRPVADALEEMIRGRSVQDREPIVRRLEEEASRAGCHQLYIGGTDLKRSLAVILSLKGSGVFTVSNAVGFAKGGGMAELFLEDGRLRIAVNVDALQRARVRLSSRVLALATIVRDAPTQ
jgi:hypothetical protein